MCRQAVIQRHTVNDFNYYLRALKCILHMNTHSERYGSASIQCSACSTPPKCITPTVHHARTQPYTRISEPTNNWSKQLEKKEIIRFNVAPKKKQSRYEKEKKRKEKREKETQNKIRVKRTKTQHMYVE